MGGTHDPENMPKLWIGNDQGINRSIFLDDQDREEFFSRFARLLVETQTDCLAWALLDTHFHLLIQPTSSTLSHFMRRLLTGYAVTFNLRHNRVGHLFQNHYKSIVCDGDAYLLELVLYIHLNPLRAVIIDNLDSLHTYPWCGHRELLGRTSRSFIAQSQVLPLFANRRRAARHLYHRFIVDGANQSLANLFSGGKRASLDLDPDLDENALFDDRVLGGGGFAERILRLADQVTAEKKCFWAELIDLVANDFEIDKALVSQPNKNRILTQAKAVICYVAIRQLGVKGVEIAPTLAYTPAAVSHAAARGKQIFLKHCPLTLDIFYGPPATANTKAEQQGAGRFLSKIGNVSSLSSASWPSCWKPKCKVRPGHS
jgi:putative transposase